MRWPFGPPHLTLEPSKQKQKQTKKQTNNKQNKKTKRNKKKRAKLQDASSFCLTSSEAWAKVSRAPSSSCSKVKLQARWGEAGCFSTPPLEESSQKAPPPAEGMPKLLLSLLGKAAQCKLRSSALGSQRSPLASCASSGLCKVVALKLWKLSSWKFCVWKLLWFWKLRAVKVLLLKSWCCWKLCLLESCSCCKLSCWKLSCLKAVLLKAGSTESCSARKLFCWKLLFLESWFVWKLFCL